MRDLESPTCVCIVFMLGLCSASCSDDGFESGSGATTGSTSDHGGSTSEDGGTSGADGGTSGDDGGTSADDGSTSSTGSDATSSTSDTGATGPTTTTETTTDATDTTTTTGATTGTGTMTGTGTHSATGTATTSYCTPEGESHGVYPGAPDCCPGLDSVGCEEPDAGNSCEQCAGATFCTDCGNNECGPGENICRCPEDCS